MFHKDKVFHLVDYIPSINKARITDDRGVTFLVSKSDLDIKGDESSFIYSTRGQSGVYVTAPEECYS
jgi:hypothetical protein